VKPVNMAAYVGDSVSFSCTYNSSQPNDFLSFEAWNDVLAPPGWDIVFWEGQDVIPPYDDTYVLVINNSMTNEFVIDIDSTDATHAIRHSCFMNVTAQRHVVFVSLLGETKPCMAIKLL
jgi:hypothetical protein